ncbi:hypothetical protein EH206_19455 [Brenneria nigrifluens DSM 30175 = ATCC 13028]|uniref:DUF7000 domain-containing protein n=1 Tax=Brenneria nigrifluens DSM 30175 = ATCC 13028 TaxID=1121120 RepID=A0A2U1UHB3_9GAMM|nr:hypothetical protein DDT54_19845 [Brenneria nigrifluens DSM 30175 = ATCC 13028]QCR07033.1 hypothetical protein EH206_19455 [Brenneria nigrifluens DSM 30175 = ATCC 13028]
MQNIDKSIAIYKVQLEQGDIQKAYQYLLRYVMHLKVYFTSSLTDKFSCGNVSPGYMDFTYFPFFDGYLRERKLRFGIVLNHKALRFELWLMGQNATVQKAYWSKLKNSQWNAERTEMPQYSVLETILVESPDFTDADLLTEMIKKEALRVSETVLDSLKVFDTENKSY